MKSRFDEIMEICDTAITASPPQLFTRVCNFNSLHFQRKQANDFTYLPNLFLDFYSNIIIFMKLLRHWGLSIF